jgi:hypothetical protein
MESLVSGVMLWKRFLGYFWGYDLSKMDLDESEISLGRKYLNWNFYEK